ncbi:MAG TPA: D-alanyl-D-alanine carboxypeptidase, partial [Brevibacillus sp.]|nr:D-alanyl-D-alanine carboxypeptidase [Brevibacillus sp.]
MRFLLTNLLVVVILLWSQHLPAAFAEGDLDTASLALNGESAILIDAKTGQVLYEKNPHAKLYPASIT